MHFNLPSVLSVATATVLLPSLITATPVDSVITSNLVERQTSSCDALACARDALKDATVGAFCLILESAFEGSSGPLCGTGVAVNGRGGGSPCQACTKARGGACSFAVGQAGGGVDEKAQGKACGPGDLAQLGAGMCVQPKSSVPNPDPNSDVQDGDYIIHCANAPDVPSGLTTDGGTCVWDCSQCSQCVNAGKTNQVVMH